MNVKKKMTAILMIAIFMISTLAMMIPVNAMPSYPYSYSTTIQVDGSSSYLVVNVTENGEWVTWEFDFPVEDFIGDGNLNVGLIIALDGEGEGPAFQVHNNDGTDSSFDWGTWLVSPWGPTISDGWNGWHSGDTNTEVEDLNWITASGDRKGQGTDGILTISINKAKLKRNFFWAASPTVGSGFYSPMYDTTMQVPTDFGWATPLVDMDEPNYILAQIRLPTPKPKKHGGPTYYDGISPGDMSTTPHKLISVNLRDGPIDTHYYVTVLIYGEDSALVYGNTFFVRPKASRLSLYLHESVFPDNYIVVAFCDTGPLPYLVASRSGIERSG